MAKGAATFVCQSCGGVHPKWSGRCGACGAWNTLVEEQPLTQTPMGKAVKGKTGHTIEFLSLQQQSQPAPRVLSHTAEFDRVTGGGLVPGSVLLVGGDPGIGKSTLLLQVTAALSRQGTCYYISGEEAPDQIRMRAKRLGVEQTPVQLASATRVEDILKTLSGQETPLLVVIDSIQTMYLEALEAAPGSVSQVRACTHELIRLAKKKGFALILVGHVTKEGTLAGPRVLEHMVDTVLYFEGERGHHYRILRTVKNRFGATDEIGVFEMTLEGLKEVGNPSALFLSDRTSAVSGAAIFAGMEGTRPLLMEIQALVGNSTYATPRRATVGWDATRLSMILAVLENRCGVSFAQRDVYLNVASGMRIQEPAVDLAVAAALMSALTHHPLPAKAVFFGEVGLSGEIRRVPHMDQRLKEAAKLGFESAYGPALETSKMPLDVVSCNHLRDFFDTLGLHQPTRNQNHDRDPNTRRVVF
ncbi:MAG: DNA repair protein RadA [Holosporales bacterium]